MEQAQPTIQQIIGQLEHLRITNPQTYESSLLQIIETEVVDANELELKAKEQAFYKLADFYISKKYPIKFNDNNSKVDNVQQLVLKSMSSLNEFTKTRAAKIIRQLIDQVALVPNTELTQIQLCITLIEWCSKEKKTYLRHKIEIRLAALYQQTGKFTKGLEIIDNIIVEVRKADDKHMMLEIYLTESKLNFGIENLSKAKASLTAARACANSIYCPPQLQAEIDLMGGIIHAEEKDYKTAYSYFYESFEAFNSLEDQTRALKSFKYMILAKIMTNNQDDVNQLLASKHGLKYAGRDLDAMKSINDSYSRKSLTEFTNVLKEYTMEIELDNILKLHIESLYQALLEKNLFSVIQPYSKVQISYIAERMKLSQQDIQRKLSELILDKKVDGTLDQGNGCLILFDSLKNDDLYKNSLDVIKNMNDVVEKLGDRIKQLKN